MKIGLVITTYNRPEYVNRCLETIRALKQFPDAIYVYDDCSDNLDSLTMIATLYTIGTRCSFIRAAKNEGIQNSILKAFDRLIWEGYDVLINLDADAIVKPDFITRLTDMLAKHPDKIITGFNTITGGRHKPVSYFDGGVYKRTIGGINMCMTAETYRDIVRPNLTAKNWDWKVCEEMQRRNKYFVALTPSCVQHIGLVSSMGHYDGGVDVADDF